MSRYGSRNRWVKGATGAYWSPCGRFRAVKEAYSRWRLMEVTPRASYGPFVTLADCQDHAERLEGSL